MNPADIGPGVAYSAAPIRQWAAEALREQPTDKTRHYCFTGAADRLERDALRRIAPARAAE